MKKILSVLLVGLIVVCMSFSAYAKPGEFVESVSKNPAPELVQGKPSNIECLAQLIITSYLDRYNLPDDLLKLIELAYKEIANCTNITELCNGLEAIAMSLKIPVLNLAVSDLFDLRYVNCDNHEGHGYFDVVLKAETLNNFVALIHRTADGWEVIDNARVEEINGEWHLYFSATDFSPFAIVVNHATISENNPHTGDNKNIYIYSALMAAAALTVIVALKRNKKETA